MSVDPTEEYEYSVNPARVQAELGRYLTTAVNYVRRQGMTPDQIEQTVREALVVRLAAAPKPFVPELLDKGISDMRINKDA